MFAWKRVFSAGGVYWAVDGVSPPMTGLLESMLYLVSPASSLRNKDLSVKSLFFFHLGTFRCWFAGTFLSPGVEPPFRPDQKVKLDKAQAGRGSLLRRGFLPLTLKLPNLIKRKLDGATRPPRLGKTLNCSVR